MPSGLRTESYVQRIRRFILFHKKQHPKGKDNAKWIKIEKVNDSYQDADRLRSTLAIYGETA